MDKETVVAVLLVISAALALIDAFRSDILPKVGKLALAVAVAASALFVQFTGFFGGK